MVVVVKAPHRTELDRPAASSVRALPALAQVAAEAAPLLVLIGDAVLQPLDLQGNNESINQSQGLFYSNESINQSQGG